MKILKSKLIQTIAIITIVCLFVKCSSNSTLVDDIDKNLDYFFISGDIFLSKADTNSNEKIGKIVSLIEAAKYEEGLNIISNLENNIKNNFEIKNLKGICYAGLAKYEDSKKEFEKILKLPDYKEIDKSIIFNNLGSLHIIQMKLDDAEKYFINIKIDEHNSKFYSCVQYNLSRCYGEQGENELKKQNLIKIKNILNSEFFEEKKLIYFVEIFLATSDKNILNNTSAFVNIDRNIEKLKQELGNNHPEIAYLYNLKGSLYYKKMDYLNSVKSFEYALEIQKKSLPNGHFDFSYSYNNLHIYYEDTNEFHLAKKYAYLSFKILLNYPENYINFANNLNNTGILYYDITEYETAINYFLKAHYIYSLNNYMYNLSQMSLNNIRNCYIQLNYDISKFEVWLEEQTRDMTKDKVYAEMEEILNGSDWT